MKMNKIKGFAIRVIEGQTSSLETFMIGIGILVIAVIIAKVTFNLNN